MPEMAEPAADDVDSRCIIFYEGKSKTTFILHLSSTCGNGNEMVAFSPTAESSEKYSMCKNCVKINTTYYKGKSKSSYILHLSSLCGNGSGMINFVPTVNFEKYSV
ncbi:hypothetical protein SARC_07247 [Sphaeroforma arctica JP610]|uniref:Uncharacterized protein n=1 Tax=Sphaeroforma arctica JP610 TaxID=667725 RepID=A0A0L0FU64_9EUKA|nr:hypothetical protein SARC_07247 [Sphaeroforma arctica JP610]KNC80390.1 hypothetical protein SARC_07247 [Sphaeroforma arctica JP610]|eukprot:XP_014154292.1 hypothetical protein SARC_07247 [Sphaeroforma arctica JP610]